MYIELQGIEIKISGEIPSILTNKQLAYEHPC